MNIIIKTLLNKNVHSFVLYNIWNKYLATEADLQNKIFEESGLESYHLPHKNDHPWANTFYQELELNFLDIQTEILELLKEYDGLPMIELDDVQKSLGKDAYGWKPLWIKFLDQWSDITDNLPTLTRIAKKYPDLLLLHASVMEPNTFLQPHYGISKGVWRLHFGIKIPEGNVRLNLCGKLIAWQNGKGFIWDDTLPHADWNYSSEKRIIIFADIPRHFKSNLKTRLNIWLHKMLKYCSHVKNIQYKIGNSKKIS